MWTRWFQKVCLWHGRVHTAQHQAERPVAWLHCSDHVGGCLLPPPCSASQDSLSSTVI